MWILIAVVTILLALNAIDRRWSRPSRRNDSLIKRVMRGDL